MSNQLKLWWMTTRHRIASDEGSAFEIEMVVELVPPNIMSANALAEILTALRNNDVVTVRLNVK